MGFFQYEMPKKRATTQYGKNGEIEKKNFVQSLGYFPRLFWKQKSTVLLGAGGGNGKNDIPDRATWPRGVAE